MQRRAVKMPAPALEQIVHTVSRSCLGKDRLPDTERDVVGAGQGTRVAHRTGDDATKLLEQRVRILQPASSLVTLEPRIEILVARFPTGRHLDTLDEFTERIEVECLVVVSVAVGEIQCPGILHEIGRQADVEHIADGLLHLLECQRRLAAAGRADEHQGWRQVEDGSLIVIERQHLVEHMESIVGRIEIDQWFRLYLGHSLHIRYPGFVNTDSLCEEA